MRVFLDVDGVLADFTMGVHKTLGIDLDYRNWPYAFGSAGWDWNHKLDMSFMQVSEICDFDFWANLPWTQDGRDILRVILEYTNDITLLTMPMPHVMSASGKMAWVKKNLPVYEKHVLVSTESKDVLARIPDSVLVDDNQENVDRWRCSGGRSVIVPRPWNNSYMCGDAPPYIRQQLENLCQPQS